jgi:purine nucleosidase
MSKVGDFLLVVLCPLILIQSLGGEAQASSIRDKVIIDTDIGISIDDPFAVALALNTPELEILGFSTSSGDTLARAKILDRMLGESRIESIPVLVGVPTTFTKGGLPPSLLLMQRRYGETGHYGKASHGNAVDYTLQQIRRHPGEITLVTIGPLSNVAAMIDKDINTVRKLKKLVIMGGWIAPIVDALGERSEPAPEHNVSLDTEAARKVFAAGIPLYVIPLDATNALKLNEVDRRVVFTAATPMTNALTVLYTLWGYTTPTLHDVLAVAFVTYPQLCPVEPMQVTVDAEGITRVSNGTPNAQVCMRSEPRALMEYFLRRIHNGTMDTQLTISSNQQPLPSH